MKKYIVMLITIFTSLTNAQWEKVNDYNVGVTGKILSYNGSVYLHGDNGPYKIYKSADEGVTWTDITPSNIEDFSDIYNFNGKLYGCWIESIFVSGDGSSWSVLSTVSLEGAIRGFTNDGNILYAYSNRAVIFKSTDDGNSWTGINIQEPENLQIIDFAAVGNVFVVITSQGSYVSTDGGATFTLNQPATAISGVHSFNSELYGFSFGDGVYKFDVQNNQWVKKSSGLPSDGVFVLPAEIVNVGNTIFVSYSQLLGNSGVAMSNDFGESWSVLSSEGLPTQNGNNNIAATSSSLLEFYFGVFDSENTGTYRTPISVSSVKNEEQGIPNSYSLSQNYPNPFNPSTTIKFSIPQNGHVALTVYDVLGKEVAELVNEELSAGSYSVVFDVGKTTDFSSGIYFYRLESSNFTQTKKFMLVK